MDPQVATLSVRLGRVDYSSRREPRLPVAEHWVTLPAEAVVTTFRTAFTVVVLKFLLA